MNSWRITKYNPKYRNELGHYKKHEWTSVSGIGEVFNGEVLCADEYLRVENLYIDAVLEILECNGIDKLTVNSLEKHRSMKWEIKPNKNLKRIRWRIKSNDNIQKDDLSDVIKLILREQFWCHLEHENKMFVHFGYDYYMYVGSI